MLWWMVLHLVLLLWCLAFHRVQFWGFYCFLSMSTMSPRWLSLMDPSWQYMQMTSSSTNQSAALRIIVVSKQTLMPFRIALVLVTWCLYRQFYSWADSNTLLLIYCTCIWPRLMYACQLWDPFSSKCMQSLEAVQKFTCKVCLKQWNLEYESMVSGHVLSP